MSNDLLENKACCFDDLLRSVCQCTLCDRMDGRRKVLSLKNGDIHSKVMFIAEAPGRLGAECTGIPLYGDRSGKNFEFLLNNIGWNRADIFITNSILCNPRDSVGNNASPTPKEIMKCSCFLKTTIELVNPDVIVTLGATALDALKLIQNHTLTLHACVATLHDWNGRSLFPLYHTGSRATLHRSLIQQRSDFVTLSHLVDPLKGLRGPL